MHFLQNLPVMVYGELLHIHIQQVFVAMLQLRIALIFRSLGSGVHPALTVFKSRRSSLSELEA